MMNRILFVNDEINVLIAIRPSAGAKHKSNIGTGSQER